MGLAVSLTVLTDFISPSGFVLLLFSCSVLLFILNLCKLKCSCAWFHALWILSSSICFGFLQQRDKPTAQRGIIQNKQQSERKANEEQQQEAQRPEKEQNQMDEDSERLHGLVSSEAPDWSHRKFFTFHLNELTRFRPKSERSPVDTSDSVCCYTV